jgi:hypothetical protein
MIDAPAGKEDQQKIREAKLLLCDLIMDNVHINPNQWASALFSAVICTYNNAGLDYESVKSMFNSALEFYKDELEWKEKV